MYMSGESLLNDIFQSLAPWMFPWHIVEVLPRKSCFYVCVWFPVNYGVFLSIYNWMCVILSYFSFYFTNKWYQSFEGRAIGGSCICVRRFKLLLRLASTSLRPAWGFFPLLREEGITETCMRFFSDLLCETWDLRRKESRFLICCVKEAWKATWDLRRPPWDLREAFFFAAWRSRVTCVKSCSRLCVRTCMPEPLKAGRVTIKSGYWSEFPEFFFIFSRNFLSKDNRLKSSQILLKKGGFLYKYWRKKKEGFSLFVWITKGFVRKGL